MKSCGGSEGSAKPGYTQSKESVRFLVANSLVESVSFYLASISVDLNEFHSACSLLRLRSGIGVGFSLATHFCPAVVSVDLL